MTFIYIKSKVISKNDSRFTQSLWTVFLCPWRNPFKALCWAFSSCSSENNSDSSPANSLGPDRESVINFVFQEEFKST